jgi:hypothetical protein
MFLSANTYGEWMILGSAKLAGDSPEELAGR